MLVCGPGDERPQRNLLVSLLRKILSVCARVAVPKPNLGDDLRHTHGAHGVSSAPRGGASCGCMVWVLHCVWAWRRLFLGEELRAHPTLQLVRPRPRLWVGLYLPRRGDREPLRLAQGPPRRGWAVRAELRCTHGGRTRLVPRRARRVAVPGRGGEGRGLGVGVSVGRVGWGLGVGLVGRRATRRPRGEHGPTTGRSSWRWPGQTCQSRRRAPRAASSWFGRQRSTWCRC